MFIENTAMQQRPEQFTIFTSFGLLFRPSSDHSSFGIKEKTIQSSQCKNGNM